MFYLFDITDASGASPDVKNKAQNILLLNSNYTIFVPCQNQNAMRKNQLISEISEKTGIEKPKVEATLEAFMTSVKEHILKKESVSLRGFGNFIVKKRAAKIARNISKNTAINLPAHYIPKFKPAKKFLEKVKKGVK